MSFAIEHLPLERLKPAERNARLHSNKQIRRIAEKHQALRIHQPYPD